MQELLLLGVPSSEIAFQRIDAIDSLKATWAEWAKYDEVDQLYFFSHGYAESAEVYLGSGDFWKSASKLNWSSTSKSWLGTNPISSTVNTLGQAAYFFGCNTANGTFAQNFANTQGVKTYAQPGFTNFSKSTLVLSPINEFGTDLGIYLMTFSWKVIEKKLHINTNGIGIEFIPK